MNNKFTGTHKFFRVFLLVLIAACVAPLARTQGLDAASLLKPPTDTWPTYNGDYSGRRYSTLDQINSLNVNTLTLAWAFRTPRNTIKSTPSKSTASFTSPLPTMSGRLTPATAVKSGITN